MTENATSTGTRFDAIEVGDRVRTLAMGWLLVVKVAAFRCTVMHRDTVRLYLVADNGERFELNDRPTGTIETRKAEPVVTAVTLLRLISDRAAGTIGGGAVDAKIAELTDRFGVTVTTS